MVNITTINDSNSGRLPKGQVVVIEPSLTHYYQPLWTLVGGGLKEFSQSERPMKSVLPSTADWLKDSVVRFDPENNKLEVGNGDTVFYEFLVVAMGLELHYEKVKGLPEAFDFPGVGSNYSPKYVSKTRKAIEEFEVMTFLVSTAGKSNRY